MRSPHRLLQCVTGLTRLVSGASGAPTASGLDARQPRVRAASDMMRELVAYDDWLPDAMALPEPRHYQQYLLYGDPLERFSLVSFVWGPGQATPIHNHTVWGVIAVLRGAEMAQRFRVGDGAPVALGDEARLERGDLDIVAPDIGDVHRVRNAYADQVSVSIHLYGGNIGRIRRVVFDAATGAAKPFVSGYSNEFAPNLWAPASP